MHRRALGVAVLVCAAGLAAYALSAAVRVKVQGLVSAATIALTARTDANVPYGTDELQRLDVFVPRGVQKTRPGVLVFHGGGWVEGRRTDVVRRVCRKYLDRGFVVVNADYRPGIRQASEDAVSALRWVTRNTTRYGIDSRRIVVTGESAGAHLALVAGLDRQSGAAAVINFYAVTNVLALADRPLIQRALLADDVNAIHERWSPVLAVRPGIAILSIHGSHDPLVPAEQTEAFTRRHKQAGGVAEQLIIPMASHSLGAQEVEQSYQKVFSFLESVGVM